jgi:hypothetical protein
VSIGDALTTDASHRSANEPVAVPTNRHGIEQLASNMCFGNGTASVSHRFDGHANAATNPTASIDSCDVSDDVFVEYDETSTGVELDERECRTTPIDHVPTAMSLTGPKFELNRRAKSNDEPTKVNGAHFYRLAVSSSMFSTHRNDTGHTTRLDHCGCGVVALHHE